ncbi:hypothetical protein PUN28_002721 [Cardiocondyla obscurior]|uniref:Uncharacterized protein n=1 Tax=Cardiocondyla obscurior TaxID=286306 RepID=A0AAW2GVX4_9HYME
MVRCNSCQGTATDVRGFCPREIRRRPYKITSRFFFTFFLFFKDVFRKSLCTTVKCEGYYTAVYRKILKKKKVIQSFLNASSRFKKRIFLPLAFANFSVLFSYSKRVNKPFSKKKIFLIKNKNSKSSKY